MNKPYLLDNPAQLGTVEKLSFGKRWFKLADLMFEKVSVEYVAISDFLLSCYGYILSKILFNTKLLNAYVNMRAL